MVEGTWKKNATGFVNEMNVGLLASFYPVILGGAEVGLGVLLDGYKDIGLKHVLFTLSKVHGTTSNEIVPIRFFGHIPKKLKLFGLPVFDPILAKRLSMLIRRNCIDLLHVQDTLSLRGAVTAVEDSGIPIVLSYHNVVGIPHASFGVPYPLNAWMDAREADILEAARKCSMVIANSEYTAGRLAAAGLSRARVKAIYIGGAISSWVPEVIGSRHDPLRVLGVGRLQAHKGFHNLIFAAHRAFLDGTNIDIVIAGNGPYRRKLSLLVTELGMQRRVRTVGHVSPQKLISLYDWSDVVVLPTITPEPFGRVAVEAMSRGKVVIGSNIGGIPEIIDDGETGFLVPPDSPTELAEKLSFLSARPDVRREMGPRALERCKERFNFKKITEQVLDIYRNMNLTGL